MSANGNGRGKLKAISEKDGGVELGQLGRSIKGNRGEMDDKKNKKEKRERNREMFASVIFTNGILAHGKDGHIDGVL